MKESILKRLMTSIKCAVCGQSYEVDSVVVLGHRQDLWFLSALCFVCHSQSLMAAVIEESREPEVITDLNETERDKFGNIPVLTVDDVLDMHNCLKDFDGDFSWLVNLK